MKTKNLVVTISPMNQDKVKKRTLRLVNQTMERLEEIVGIEATDNLMESKLGKIILEAAGNGMQFQIIRTGEILGVVFI